MDCECTFSDFSSCPEINISTILGIYFHKCRQTHMQNVKATVTFIRTKKLAGLNNQTFLYIF